MNDTTKRPLVRPKFVKISLLVFVLLIPFVVHAACDYSESRTLARTLVEIRAAGEPISIYEIDGNARNLIGPTADAARYYRAAAALAYTNFREQLPQQMVDESLRFLDMAARLEFKTFPASFDSRNELSSVAGLAYRRTQLLLDAGDVDGARASFYSQLRLAAVRSYDFWPLLRFSEINSTLSGILADRGPDAGKLEPIAAALQELDKDDVIRRQLLRERAFYLDNRYIGTRSTGFWFRPLYLRFINARVDILRSLIGGASRPWPQRLEAPKNADYSRIEMFSWLGRLGPPAYRANPAPREIDESRVLATARNLAIIRCARAAVAAVQYRHDTGAFPSRIDDLTPRYLYAAPIDPFSGASIQLADEAGGFRVLSVGKERNGRRIEIQIAQR